MSGLCEISKIWCVWYKEDNVADGKLIITVGDAMLQTSYPLEPFGGTALPSLYVAGLPSFWDLIVYPFLLARPDIFPRKSSLWGCSDLSVPCRITLDEHLTKNQPQHARTSDNTLHMKLTYPIKSPYRGTLAGTGIYPLNRFQALALSADTPGCGSDRWWSNWRKQS